MSEAKDSNPEGYASVTSSDSSLSEKYEHESLEETSNSSLQDSESNERPKMFRQRDPVIDAAQNENEQKQEEAFTKEEQKDGGTCLHIYI